MKSLDDYKQSVIWHVVTGKYEVLPDLTLRKRSSGEMKDSRSDWIGNIPKDWETRRLKETGSMVNGESCPEEDGEIDVFGSNGPFRKTDRANFPKGTIIIGRKGSAGSVFLAKKDCWITDTAIAVVTKEPEWITETLNLAPLKTLTPTTTLPSLTMGDMGRVILPAPPRAIKTQILTFLEKFTSSLPDPTRIIEATTVWKKSLIWHVVTGKYEILDNGKLRKRGTGEMKDSGVEWIGRVPKEWGTARVKDIAEITNGSTPPTTDKSLWEPEEKNWFTPVDLTEWPTILGEANRKVSQKGADTLRTAKKGSILMSGRAPVGLLGIATEDCVFNQGCKAITSKEECLPMILFVAVDYIRSLANATTFEEISSGKTGSIKIPRIPAQEGKKIKAFLKNMTQ